MGRYVIDARAVGALGSHASIDLQVKGLADEILRDADGTVPVDTGRLRASGFVDGAESEYRIGYDTEYARYVEFGTSEQNAQPYLTPAALRDRGEL